MQLHKIILRGETYYTSSDNYVFSYTDTSLALCGKLSKSHYIEPCHKSIDSFRHKNKLELKHKNTIIYYLKTHIHPHTKILFQALSKSFNIIVLGSLLWNVILGNVIFMNVHDEFNMKLIKEMNGMITKIYFEDPSIFIHFRMKLFTKCNLNYVYHHQSPLQNYNSIPINYSMLANFDHCIDKYIFYSSDDLKLMKNEGIISDNKVKLCKYIISEIVCTHEPNVHGDETIIVSFDEYYHSAINFLSSQTDENTILFLYDDEDKLRIPKQLKHRVRIFRRDFEIFMRHLASASILYTNEMRYYTHFSLCIAPKANKSIKIHLPKFYQEFASEANNYIFI